MRLRHTITEQRSIVPIKGMAWSRDFQVPQEGAWVAVRSANVRTDFRSTIIFSTPCHVGKDARVTKQLASEQALLFARFARPNSRACSQATKQPAFYTKVKVSANRVTTWPDFYSEFFFF